MAAADKTVRAWLTESQPRVTNADVVRVVRARYENVQMSATAASMEPKLERPTGDLFD